MPDNTPWLHTPTIELPKCTGTKHILESNTMFNYLTYGKINLFSALRTRLKQGAVIRGMIGHGHVDESRWLCTSTSWFTIHDFQQKQIRSFLIDDCFKCWLLCFAPLCSSFQFRHRFSSVIYLVSTTVWMCMPSCYCKFHCWYLHRFVMWTFLVLSNVYSKQPIFGLTQEWLREVWSPRQGICLFIPCVGSFTSPAIDTR